jgi:hypothetical protein
LNWKGKEEFFDFYVDFWNVHYCFKNDKFENLFLGNRISSFSQGEFFCVGQQPYVVGLVAMKILNGTIQWILLCSIPCMILLSFS